MELFKHRNLAFGCGCFLVLLFASFYFNTAARIATLIFAGIAILLLIFVIIVTVKSFLARRVQT